MKKSFVLVLFVVFASTSLFAQKSEIFEKDGIALQGYDVVAFHTKSKPVPGKEAFIYRWKDTNWLFENQSNLDLFRKEPEKYAPQYGGYCAFGAADGHKAPTEINTWTIQDHKLYFNYNKQVQARWNQDQAGYIKKADKNWINIKDKP